MIAYGSNRATNPCFKSKMRGAKENGILCSPLVLEEYKMKIGRYAAVKALVDLLESGTLRWKKDAATTLFNLSIFHARDEAPY
ncbi:hypothetical protein IFM89_005352 [Coptis chinensis]|uniref:Uncharacterized protein n=1 Tax=Coptis chinensis TaxID=261450 RepID=A0A835HAR7_9MAGN|nr:hypothetical protein IFM89_005352 [Coptis chinensis]